jgi:acyl-CoA thioesterase
VPRPLDCATRPIQEDGPFSSINYHHQTEVRPASGFNPWDRDDVPPSEPRTASWFRFREPPIRPDGTWEPGTLAVPADVLGSAVHAGIGSSAGFFLVVSLQISLQLVADARTDWLLQHTRAHVADQGFSTGTAELWGEDGTLVAIATQCARLQPLTPRG